jgi:hypothetical protein
MHHLQKKEVESPRLPVGLDERLTPYGSDQVRFHVMV